MKEGERDDPSAKIRLLSLLVVNLQEQRTRREKRERREREDASAKVRSWERDRGFFSIFYFLKKKKTNEPNQVVQRGITWEVFNLREIDTYCKRDSRPCNMDNGPCIRSGQPYNKGGRSYDKGSHPIIRPTMEMAICPTDYINRA